MRGQRLTEQSKHINGKLASSYAWEGHEVWVYDSARSALLLEEFFADTELTEKQKSALLPLMVLVEPEKVAESAQNRFSECLAAICWDAFGIDLLDKHRSNEAPAFDWVEDAGRIRSSFFEVYGIDFDSESENISYRAVCDLLASMIETGEGSFARAVHYRTAKRPKATKYNKEELKAFDAAKKYYALKTSHKATKRADGAIADAFAAEFKAAGGKHG